MRTIIATLDAADLSGPADPDSHSAILAEMARAQGAIDAAIRDRTQATYYLVGASAGLFAILLNAVITGDLVSIIDSPTKTDDALACFLAQLCFSAVALLALVVHGVVYKANDSMRFHNRQILRLTDVLYGLPEDGKRANPVWVAMAPKPHDLRDPEDRFSLRGVSETAALALFALFSLGLLALYIFACWELNRVLAFTSAALIVLLQLLAMRYACPLVRAERKMRKWDNQMQEVERLSLQKGRTES